jgi:hypothetical protein
MLLKMILKIEGRINVMGRRWRQLLDDLKEIRRY